MSSKFPADEKRQRKDPALIVVLGPTASGKSALAMALALAFDGEIVSCDSVAVYRGLDIGAAKPSREQQSRAPHHLIDVAAPDEPYSAGEYSRAARAAIAEIAGRGRLPILSGGTGLYLRAALAGLFAGPQRSESLRTRLRQTAARRGPGYVHRLLARLDPVSAARIHAHDLAKGMRAIEVTLAARQPMSQAWQMGRDPLTGYRILRLGLQPPREQLYARINERARAMFERGLIEETKGLLERYERPPLGAPSALDSLGYRQAAGYLRGALTLEEAIAAASQGHRNYAKRQLTWFRREPGVVWLQGFGDSASVQTEALDLVAKHL
ncbi:MAG TPA: tRNA (adenosine(37)-N6)-dimethylallyltransferase MiaA [Acidobacteriaceae bacterium]|nr:tRNA (adenosine(37)-N6)-dimethylallyltransferase MiaA [Acidobacteriaceae bacterium]